LTTSAFVSGVGFLYSYDSRAKLFNLILITVFLFLPMKVMTLWSFCLVTFLLTIYSVGFKQACQPLKTILFLLAIMVLFVPLTYRDSQALLRIGTFTLATKEAVLNLQLLSSRFIAITYLAALFIYTTPMADIQLALRWYGMPYNGALVMSLSFRFIPFVANSFGMIQDAYRLREIENEQSKKRRFSFGDIIATVTAALVVALKAIPYMAMSLEHRGFGGTIKRSNYRLLKPRGGLLLHFVIAIIVNLILLAVFMIF